MAKEKSNGKVGVLLRSKHQKWRYSSKAEGKKPKSKRGRYLPDAAWKALSPAESCDQCAKRKGTKAGKQFVRQPKKIAKKTRSYRK